MGLGLIHAFKIFNRTLEFLKGFMIEDSKRKYSNYPEFNLDPEEIVR